MNKQELDIKKYQMRLFSSRMRILQHHGFYGLLLMHMNFTLNPNCETAYTDGNVIAFSPVFMDELSNDELDFIMMHEILHVALMHCFRTDDRDPFLFNIACDIVVNSNILYNNDMDKSKITLKKYGESMHLINGEEGYLYTAEEVYAKLMKSVKKIKVNCIIPMDGQGRGTSDVSSNSGNGTDLTENGKGKKKANNESGKGKDSNSNDANNQTDVIFDDHSKWKKDIDNIKKEELKQRIMEAYESQKKDCGKLPLGMERIIDDFKNPSIDWRLLLNEFIQEEVNDYTFSPPDRRYDDSPFFLPDYNGKTDKIDKLLFMIDTSGSINENELKQAYSEIKGALEQYDNLEGLLGFFDAKVYKPISFSSVDDLIEIKPKGGGGTDFKAIFKYIERNMEEKPKLVIILTDGCADFPNERECFGLPVLWLINNKNHKPIYGASAIYKVQD